MLEIESKRVALIRPANPGEDFSRSLPVGLLTLASNIKQYGYQPIVIDLSLFQSPKNSSDYFSRTAERILSFHPQVLGFNVMCSTLPVALLIAEECKKLAPELPIIFGGPEVSFEEVEVLKTFKQVDIIVRGEGEITLIEVLKALENKRSLSDVLGITFRENDQIIRNPDRPFINNLDQLPFLDYSLIPHLEKYKWGWIEGGRGCPYSCTFCSTCRMWKRNFRMKSPWRLVQELKEAYRIFKREVLIIHDHFLASRKVAEEFLSVIANESLAWSCYSRLEVLDENLIKKLKQAGCRIIYLGIESGSPEMQKEIKKNLPLFRLPLVLDLLSRNEICAVISFIIGFPNETESQIDQTLLMALNSKLLNSSIAVRIHPFTFLKGSELFIRAKEKFTQSIFRETTISLLTSSLSAELLLVKKYPRIFVLFYHIGNEEIHPIFSQKLALLYLFLLKSYARPTLSLLEYLLASPFQLGQRIISFFDSEGVDWNFTQGDHFPQYFSPFRKFIQEYASPLYKEFFWWDKGFTRREKR